MRDDSLFVAVGLAISAGYHFVGVLHALIILSGTLFGADFPSTFATFRVGLASGENRVGQMATSHHRATVVLAQKCLVRKGTC